MWNSMEKLRRSFFHYSDVRGMDYSRPLITFPSASQRPVTLLRGQKFSPFPPQWVIVLLITPGQCFQKVPCDKWHCEGANARPLGQVMFGSKQGANRDVWEPGSVCHCRMRWFLPGVPLLPSCPPKSGHKLRGCCAICPALVWVRLLWFLQRPGTFLEPPLFLSVLPQAHEIQPQDMWGKGMLTLVNPWLLGGSWNQSFSSHPAGTEQLFGDRDFPN